MRVSKTLLLLYGTRHVVERWVRESYCPISARSQMLWASLRDAISGRR